MKSYYNYFFNSERLRFRPSNKDDLDFVINLENDNENKKYIIPWSKAQHLEAIQCREKNHFIFNDLDGKPIGYIILAGIGNEHNNIELVRITIAQKQNGYGKEALRAIQKHVFIELNAHRLWLDVKEYNDRARRVYESSGFKQEGVLRECIKVGDQYESLVIMSILRNEYFCINEEGRGIS